MITRNRILSKLVNDEGRISSSNISTSLSDFDDIDITSTAPETDQILRYNSSTGKFEPQSPNITDFDSIILISQVDSDIQSVIGIAPETLDTLIEIENTMDSVSTIETIKARVAGYKCEVFDGDGTTKIFSTRTHKAGYISVTVDGIEMIDRVASTSDTTSANRLTSGYDFYSGTGTSAYQVVTEYQDTGTPLLFDALYWSYGTQQWIWLTRYGSYPFYSVENWDIGGLVPAGIRNEGYVGARSAVGDILRIDDTDGDIIFRTGNQQTSYAGGAKKNWNTQNSGVIPIYSRGGVVPSGTPSGEVSPFTVADPYFYKLQSITAPNPSHAQQSSDKIYFLTAPSNGSKIVVRYYE